VIGLLRLPPDDPRHGSTAGYHLCHCDACKEASAAYQREKSREKARRRGKINAERKPQPALTDAEKIEALGKLDNGTSTANVAEQFGYPSAEALLFAVNRWRRQNLRPRSTIRLHETTKTTGETMSKTSKPAESASDNIEVIAAQQLREVLIGWGPCFHPVQPCDCWPDVREAIENTARVLNPGRGW